MNQKVYISGLNRGPVNLPFTSNTFTSNTRFSLTIQYVPCVLLWLDLDYSIRSCLIAMPKKSYWSRHAAPRSNNYLNALRRTGIYNQALEDKEAHDQRHAARIQVASDTNNTPEVRQEAVRDLKRHGQALTVRRLGTLATFTPTETLTLKEPKLCPCFSKGDLICFCYHQTPTTTWSTKYTRCTTLVLILLAHEWVRLK